MKSVILCLANPRSAATVSIDKYTLSTHYHTVTMPTVSWYSPTSFDSDAVNSGIAAVILTPIDIDLYY